MDRHIHMISAVIVLIVGSLLLVTSGCTKSYSEGFAIYLTKGDTAPSQMEALSHLEIADQPFIGIDDIISYNAQTYEMKLTDEAFQKIAELQVPVSGKSFVVTVDRQPVYWGAFWTPISSLSFDGVTIYKPFNSSGTGIITLSSGYPAASFYHGKDPRNDPKILDSLKQSSKLIEKLSVDILQTLPQAAKGYELYSWMADNQWQFTLISGTNRGKTVEEITSTESYISEAGWIKIRLTGFDALKNILGKVPAKEYVTWLGGPGYQYQTDINFALPPAATVEEIKALASQVGFVLQVASPR